MSKIKIIFIFILSFLNLNGDDFINIGSKYISKSNSDNPYNADEIANATVEYMLSAYLNIGINPNYAIYLTQQIIDDESVYNIDTKFQGMLNIVIKIEKYYDSNGMFDKIKIKIFIVRVEKPAYTNISLKELTNIINSEKLPSVTFTFLMKIDMFDDIAKKDKRDIDDILKAITESHKRIEEFNQNRYAIIQYR